MIHLRKSCLVYTRIVNVFWHARASSLNFCTVPTNSTNNDLIDERMLPQYPSMPHVEEVLSQYSKLNCIPWEEVTDKIAAAMKVKNTNQIKPVSTAILQSCEKLNLVSVGLSYYKYLVESGQTPSLFALHSVLKLFSCDRTEISKNQDLFENLYKEVKPYVISCENCFQYTFVKVLGEDYKYCMELVDICNQFEVSLQAVSIVISKLFDYDEYEKGVMLWQKHPKTLALKEATMSYINYCIRSAEKKRKFSVHLIDKLVNMYNQYAYSLPKTHFLPALEHLVSILNRHSKKTHIWSVAASSVDKMGVCSNCNLRLRNMYLKEEEVESIKQYVLNNIIISNNINIKTTEEELSKFLNFVEKEEYDVVLDGLNIAYRTRKFRESFFDEILEYFQIRGRTVLFIGKDYMRSTSFFKHIVRKCKTYLLNALSDDDVFVIYATLCKGRNAKYLTADNLRGYHSYLPDDRIKALFKKWQFTQRYYFSETKTIELPIAHCFLPQRTIPFKSGGKNWVENSHFCWHLSTEITDPGLVTGDSPTWLCLQRKPINNSVE